MLQCTARADGVSVYCYQTGQRGGGVQSHHPVVVLNPRPRDFLGLRIPQEGPVAAPASWACIILSPPPRVGRLVRVTLNAELETRFNLFPVPSVPSPAFGRCVTAFPSLLAEKNTSRHPFESRMIHLYGSQCICRVAFHAVSLN